ncbi:MAG: thiamine-phosphate kinase [Acidobacteria bacterium]|nr:thiamine-phosphate kinase [Acidobacteriota bacterium]
MPSEFSFINQIRQRATTGANNLILGIGDDAAIWREHEGRERLISTDLLIEDVHFKLDYTSLACLGHKALAVSLSDIAAMGGRPEFALLSLGLPKSKLADLNWQDFFDGYFSLAQKYGVALIGGDTSASPDKVVIDSVVIGTCASGKAIRRSGAKMGEAIYVTGRLGASAMGLELLQRGERLPTQSPDKKAEAIRAHLQPEPRVKFGENLGTLGLATALMDVSDGLAQDLSHICEESGVDAVLEYDVLPIAPSVRELAGTIDKAFSFAISGGEDYELLFTANPEAEAALKKCASECALEITRIGEIMARQNPQEGPRIFLRRNGRVDLLSITGYDHFRA